MPKSAGRQPQWTVMLKPVYRSDREERVHRAFALITPERPAQRAPRKEEHYDEQPHRLLRQSVQ
jgi:hypothetical protein